MRTVPLAVPLLLLALSAPLAAQRIPDVTRGAPAGAPDVRFTLPPVQQIRERANVAELLVDKAKKLKLEPAAVDSLKHLAAAINERNAPQLAVYDSTRTRMRTAQAGGGGRGGAGGGGGGGQGGPPGEGSARGGGIREATRTLAAARDADIPVVLALVPAASQDEAKKLIEKQSEDLREAMAPRGPGGPGGPGGAGGAGGRPGRP
jgi:hypothetical protein